MVPQGLSRRVVSGYNECAITVLDQPPLDYLPGASMRQDFQEDAYRVAYDEAFTELREILREFEQLRLRKDRIENVVKALQPELGSRSQVDAPYHRLRTRRRAQSSLRTHSTFA